MDYTSLKNLAYYLAQRFWADLEQHHPGIDSLHLRRDVAEAWKQRLRTNSQVIATANGEKTVVMVERIGYRQCLTPVRARRFRCPHTEVGEVPQGIQGFPQPGACHPADEGACQPHSGQRLTAVPPATSTFFPQPTVGFRAFVSRSRTGHQGRADSWRRADGLCCTAPLGGDRREVSKWNDGMLAFRHGLPAWCSGFRWWVWAILGCHGS